MKRPDDKPGTSGLHWGDIDKEISHQKPSEEAEREQDLTAKEAEKANSTLPIFGTLVMSNPLPVSSVTWGPVIIPDLWHFSLGNRIYFPIHWWSNKVLCRAIDYPHTFPTYPLSDKRISVLHVEKVMAELGDEDITCVTPILWREASDNQLRSLKQLCPTISPSDPSFAPTYASEYEKHIAFFANQDMQMFPIWYPVEHELRYKIFCNRTFDHGHHIMSVGTVLALYERLRADGFQYTPPSVQTPYTLYIEKRPPADESNPGAAKRPRYSSDPDRRISRDLDRRIPSDPDRRIPSDLDRRNSGYPDRHIPSDPDRRISSYPDRRISSEPDRRNSSDRGGRNSSERDRLNSDPRDRDRRGPSLPLRTSCRICLICTGDHSAHDHPSAHTTFRDGTPFFARNAGRNLRAAESSNSICISWNLGQTCEPHHSESRLHLCSLCGGGHRAFARDAACRRVRDGVLVP
ncbi:hypothetical protein K438DRAFT_1925390 [Mycena galopus ATCC 62051]|nr:hypothetical protein K438DRAFT_1925390 [Mycena galopus ATCC 62051]